MFSWLVTGFVTRITWQVPLVEQELLTLPENMSSPPVVSWIHVTRSLVLCVCFVDRCLSFCPFSFGHCVVCSSIYGFLLPLWYLQTLLQWNKKIKNIKLLTYLCRESTEEGIPEMTKCKCKIFVEKIFEKFAHSKIAPASMNQQQTF